MPNLKGQVKLNMSPIQDKKLLEQASKKIAEQRKQIKDLKDKIVDAIERLS